MTDSSHAGADLRISNPATSAQFIEMLNDCNAPLPWSAVGNLIHDADDNAVCEVPGPHGSAIAMLIEVAMNTCGSFRASRAGDTKN